MKHWMLIVHGKDEDGEPWSWLKKYGTISDDETIELVVT